MRALRFVLVTLLVLVALPLGYIGVFLIGYGGDSATPADVTVDLDGREIDADIVGLAAVAVALLLFVGAGALVRRR